MRWIAIAGLFLTAACENPSLGIGARIGSGGVSVSPTVSGNIGGVGVTVSP